MADGAFKCRLCDVEVKLVNGSYGYSYDSSILPPDTLSDLQVLEDAYQSGRCPLCGEVMQRV